MPIRRFFVVVVAVHTQFKRQLKCFVHYVSWVPTILHRPATDSGTILEWTNSPKKSAAEYGNHKRIFAA